MLVEGYEQRAPDKVVIHVEAVRVSWDGRVMLSLRSDGLGALMEYGFVIVNDSTDGDNKVSRLLGLWMAIKVVLYKIDIVVPFYT